MPEPTAADTTATPTVDTAATADIAAADFAALGLLPGLCDAAHAAGWALPTAVQRAAIPPILQGRDVRVQAATGAGKTAAFLLPLLQRLTMQAGQAVQAGQPAQTTIADARPRRLYLLVLSPTRELAQQTGSVAAQLAPALKTVVAVGGLSINPQMMALRGGAHVVVATPGRLLDLSRQNAVRLADLQAVVIDEADRMLDDGFIDETRRVLALLPRPRQTLLFSATLSNAVLNISQAAQSDAVHIELLDTPDSGDPIGVEHGDHAEHDRPADDEDHAGRKGALSTSPPALPAGIVQRAIVVDSARRTPLLRALIASAGWRKLLVFVATQHAAEQVADKLRHAGLPAAALHGQLSPLRRNQALADLAAGRLQVLVATDLASRGLDVPGIDAVVQHDLPRSAVDHLHRIGRTARAGAAGTAVSFVLADAPGSEAHFRLIEKRQGLRLAREQVPGFEPAAGAPAALPASSDGGVKGHRKSRKDKLREAALRS